MTQGLPPLEPGFCRFYIIRHGETEWNLKGRIQGQLDSPLTQAAIEETKQKRTQLPIKEFSAIYSSDLGRAKQTAQLLNAEHKLASFTTALIRERYLGILQGKARQDLNDRLLQLLDNLENITQLKAEDPTIDIETTEEFITRILLLLRQLALARSDEKVLLVAHSGVMRHLLHKLGVFNVKRLYHIKIENLGYFVVDSNGSEFKVRQLVGIAQRLEPKE